ncbi:MAG TPA: ATP-binding protein [Verrucomicrobiae bacterium]|nr:ATP-binding protein [Verrucomicrobiae bacterium]
MNDSFPSPTQPPEAPGEASSINWSADAPRGGKAVMNRILKEGAQAPLFFAQTLIASLRDVGYNHTTSALCEHVDNAIQAGASEIRVYFRQSGKKGDYSTDAAVYDNGSGMAPSVLKVATAFGGSTTFNNRRGIGRFGMGMKTAALSMSPVLELYSWQERGMYYNMTLDVDAIGRERSNLVTLPDPTLVNELKDEVASLFYRPMSVPKDVSEQKLLELEGGRELFTALGDSGTIVYMPNCDRLTSAKAQTLVDHAMKEMARVYRRAIGAGLKLYVNNRLVEAFDPTYSMSHARHVRFLEGVPTKLSRLVVSKKFNIPVSEISTNSAPVTIKIYRLPIEEWTPLPRKTLHNDLRVFDRLTVSMLRNDREVFAGELVELTTRHSVTSWYRIQIDFPGELDEAFGVAANKQGVRMKTHVMAAIKEAIGGDVTTLNDELKQWQSKEAAAREAAKPSPSEIMASQADPFQAKQLAPLTAEEQAQLDANLRGLAVTLRRDDESEEQAFKRVKSSNYIMVFRHDQYWPFYHVDHKFGRVILTINTAHPFFTELYEPIRKINVAGQAGSDPEDPSTQTNLGSGGGPIVALELLLLSLARAQSVLGGGGEDARQLLDTLRREWSEVYRVQLTASS